MLTSTPPLCTPPLGTPPLRTPPLRSPRGRLALAAAVAMAVAVVSVVVTNQRAGDLGAPLTARSVSAGRTATTAAPTPEVSGLRVLHAHRAFLDLSAQHTGAPAGGAAAGILLDPDTGTILWERDPHTPRAPASTTKILTALVALENLDPARTVTVTGDALHQAADETQLGIPAGSRFTVTELLDAMMLVSANDAATALAVDTVGLHRFLLAMNEQVMALGLRDSHFTNPVGLDDPGELASPYDLAVIALAAFDSFPLFRSIVGSTDISLGPSALRPTYQLHTIDRLLGLYPDAAKGIKPGYTGNAGYCLVALAERDGHRLLSVEMGAEHIYQPAKDLLEWGFAIEGLAPYQAPAAP